MIPYLAISCSILHFICWEYPTYHCSLLIPLGSFPLALHLIHTNNARDPTLDFFMYYYLAFHVTHVITTMAQPWP